MVRVRGVHYTRNIGQFQSIIGCKKYVVKKPELVEHIWIQKNNQTQGVFIDGMTVSV